MNNPINSHNKVFHPYLTFIIRVDGGKIWSVGYLFESAASDEPYADDNDENQEEDPRHGDCNDGLWRPLNICQTRQSIIESFHN